VCLCVRCCGRALVMPVPQERNHSPASRATTHATPCSPLFTALGVSCIISGTPSGWLVDRVPTHHVLIGSLAVQVGNLA
jgi:hypothetical protein